MTIRSSLKRLCYFHHKALEKIQFPWPIFNNRLYRLTMFPTQLTLPSHPLILQLFTFSLKLVQCKYVGGGGREEAYRGVSVVVTFHSIRR